MYILAKASINIRISRTRAYCYCCPNNEADDGGRKKRGNARKNMGEAASLFSRQKAKPPVLASCMREIERAVVVDAVLPKLTVRA